MNNRREQAPKDRKTIGKMTKSRGTWDIDPVERKVSGKKGKGSYKRQPKHKKSEGNDF